MPGNQAPQLSAVSVTPASPVAGQPATFSWQATDADTNSLTCTLDVESDGVLEHSGSCAAPVSHTFGQGGNFTATLTAADGAGGVATQTLVIVVDAPIRLVSRSPAAGGLVGQLLSVAVTLTSVNEIDTVLARVVDRRAAMTVTSNSGGHALFSVQFDLAGLRRGPVPVSVTATDILGTSQTSAWSVHWDDPPDLTIDSPSPFLLTGPTLRVAGACVDDAPGCQVTISHAISHTNSVFGPFSRDFDVTLDLAGAAGTSARIVIEAVDSAQQTLTASRTVWVDDSQRLSVVATVAGNIVDVRDTRLLFATLQENLVAGQPRSSVGLRAVGLTVHDRVTG